MKKKFGIILAILLCVVLVLTFAACGNKKPSDNNKQNNTPSNTETIKGVTAAQVADMEASISAYLDKWLLANAQENVVDQSALLQAALEKIKEDDLSFTDSDMNEVVPSIQVTFTESTGKYKVVVSWNKGAVKKTFEKAAQTVTYTNWAGKMNKTDGYELLSEEGETSGAIDKIVNAALSTVNKVGTNAQTAKFGVDGKIGLEVMGYNYMLHVKGNVDLANAANTEIALMIENTQKVLGGLYYKGAAEEKDCKIILQYGETYKYLDYAILNKLLSKIIKPKAEPGEDFLPTGTLKEVLDSYGVEGSVSGIVASVIDMLAQGYVKEGTDTSTYLIDLNLNSVLTQLSEMGGDLLPAGTFEGIPYLEDLDLATMHGLLGHITIAATVGGAEKDELVDFELAVNIPECTFYFNEDEGKDATKFDLPSISFALYLNDFKFITTGKIDNVIPAAAADAEYFSPTNFDIGGDIYIKDTNLELDDTFRFHFVSSVNPFKPSQAKGSLTIKRNAGNAYNAESAKNFFTVTYEQTSKLLCISGTALGMDDNGAGIYTYDFDDGVAAIKTWLGLDNWQGIKLVDGVIALKEGENAKPAMKALLDNNLANAILGYLRTVKNAGKTAQGEEDTAAPSTEQGGFSINKIGDYINGFKAIYEDLVKDGVITIGENNASIEVTPAVINKVTAAINSLKMLPMQLPTDIDQPESVKVYFNTEDYKDQLYVFVKVDDVEVVVLFDGSKDNEFDITVTVTTDNRIYKCEVIAEDEGAASFTVKFKVTDLAGAVKSDTQVTFSNFSFNWGDRNDDKLELYTSEQLAGADAIFADDGVATNLVKSVVKFLNKASVEPTAEEIGKLLIDVIFGDKSIKSVIGSFMK